MFSGHLAFLVIPFSDSLPHATSICRFSVFYWWCMYFREFPIYYLLIFCVLSSLPGPVTSGGQYNPMQPFVVVVVLCNNRYWVILVKRRKSKRKKTPEIGATARPLHHSQTAFPARVPRAACPLHTLSIAFSIEQSILCTE